MINITANTPIDAWKKCLQQLLSTMSYADNDKFYCDELVVIEVLHPCIEPLPKEFPMSQEDVACINEYIITGNNEKNVCHEWTKLYYHRMYDSPHCQFDYLVNKLKSDPQSGRAQISFWDKNVDQYGTIAPCTQIIWGRIKSGCLELHVHASSVDAYKKLLMNQQEFITLQFCMAEKLDVKVGKFYHIIDSCHINNNDSFDIKSLDFII